MSGSEFTLTVTQTTISALGFIALVVSLLYLARQTKAMSQQTQSLEESIRLQVHYGMSSDLLGIDRLFVDHPELRPYFYEDKELATDSPIYGLVVSAAEMSLTSMTLYLLRCITFQQSS